MDKKEKNIVYRCKHCRNQLFKQSDILHQASSQKDKCTSIFINTEVEWIVSRVAEDWDHNLLCPKCKTKVGEIKLDGLKCFCGEWFAPGLQISTGKIDQLTIFEK